MFRTNLARGYLRCVGGGACIGPVEEFFFDEDTTMMRGGKEWYRIWYVQEVTQICISTVHVRRKEEVNESRVEGVWSPPSNRNEQILVEMSTLYTSQEHM